MVGCPNSDPQGDLGKKKIKKEKFIQRGQGCESQ